MTTKLEKAEQVIVEYDAYMTELYDSNNITHDGRTMINECTRKVAAIMSEPTQEVDCLSFEQWFLSGDPIIKRMADSPDIMWQMQQAYIAGAMKGAK